MGYVGKSLTTDIHMPVFYTRYGSSESISSVFGLFMRPGGTVSVNLLPLGPNLSTPPLVWLFP